MIRKYQKSILQEKLQQMLRTDDIKTIPNKVLKYFVPKI